MKALPWILAGVGAGAAIAYVILNQPNRRPRRVGIRWRMPPSAHSGGAASRGCRASATKVGGKIKEGLGRVAADPDLADEGVGDQAVGAIKDGVGAVARLPVRPSDLNVGLAP